MNRYKRGDAVLFQGEQYTVKTVDGNDVLVYNDERRLRLHFLTVTPDPWS